MNFLRAFLQVTLQFYPAYLIALAIILVLWRFYKVRSFRVMSPHSAHPDEVTSESQELKPKKSLVCHDLAVCHCMCSDTEHIECHLSIHRQWASDDFAYLLQHESSRFCG